MEGVRRHCVTGVTLTAVVPRFLTLADVAEILNISATQAYALVRNGELKGMQIGGRRVWRVSSDELEAYIQRCHRETASYIEQHPFRADEPDTDSH